MNNYKVCCRCQSKLPKTAEYFCRGKNYKDGLAPHCKACNKIYYEVNKDKIAKNRKDEYWEDPEKAKVKSQKYRNTGDNRKKLNKRRRLKRQNRTEEERLRDNKKRREEEYPKIRGKIMASKKKKRQTDVNVRLKDNLRRRINEAIKNFTKSNSTMKLVGCSLKKLKTHLESQFQLGMNWDNHGSKGWHIDHIKPCSIFDLSDPKQQRKCFHYTNLQPLWASDNMIKASKYKE